MGPVSKNYDITRKVKHETKINNFFNKCPSVKNNINETF